MGNTPAQALALITWLYLKDPKSLGNACLAVLRVLLKLITAA